MTQPDSPAPVAMDDASSPFTVRAELHVDVKDALEQPRPTDTVRPGLDRVDFALTGGCCLGGRLRLSGRPLRHHQRPRLRVRGQKRDDLHMAEPATGRRVISIVRPSVQET